MTAPGPTEEPLDPRARSWRLEHAETINLCMNGHCGTLAILLHAKTGWPYRAIVVTHDEPGEPRKQVGVHAMVEHPDGGCIDALGHHLHPQSYAEVFCMRRDLDRHDGIVTYEPTDEVWTAREQLNDIPWVDIAGLAFAILDHLPVGTS